MNNIGKKQMLTAVSMTLTLAAIIVMIIGAGAEPDYTGSEYEVTGLDMRVAVSKDRTLEVETFISVDIPEPVRAAEFALPGGSAAIKDLIVDGEKAKTVRKNNGNVVSIRDPEMLTGGHHRYRICYSLAEKADSYEDKDVFTFDVIPAGWKQPVNKLHALIWFPYGFPIDDIIPSSAGPADVILSVKREPQSRSYTIGGRRIPEDYSLRLEADLPAGYWE